LKKEVTSFDVAVIIAELRLSIIGAWVTNIYQTDHKTLVFKLHRSDQSALNLLIRAGSGLYLTNFAVDKPAKPSGFCMTLRRHLRNGKIQAVEQHEFERIVTLLIRARQEEFKLVCELFGDGNIILVNAQDKILQALSYRKMRDRNVLREETLQHPPPSGKNLFKLARNDLGEIKAYEETEIVKVLARFLGVGGLYAEEILLRAKIDKNTPCRNLSEQKLDRIFGVLGQMLSKIQRSEIEPVIVVDEEGEWIDVVPFLLEKYAVFQAKPYATFNQALDDYYAKKVVEQKATKTTTELEQMLAQQERILSRQQKTMEELEQEIRKNKEIGDAIYAHFGELQLLMQEIMNAKDKGKQWNHITLMLDEAKKKGKAPALYYNSFDPENSILHLNIDQVTFSLNLRNSVQKNAAEYYERSKRSEKRLEGALKAIEETKQKITALEKQKNAVKAAETSKPIVQRIEEKRTWYEKFRWFHSSEGFLVLGGKDAVQNEILIKKHTEPHDLVFHADIVGAPFTIIKTEGRIMSEQTIKETAQFAGAFSRAWKERFNAVDVYWVHPEQVSKTPPTGQFLAKGSFMIYGKKNYLRQVELRTSIGILMKEIAKVIGGPREAIACQTSLYLEIVPGEQPSGTLAKKVRELLSQKAPELWREKVLVLSLEEIQGFIPYGKGTLLS